MANPIGILEEALENALAEAALRDEHGEIPDNPEGVFGDTPTTHVDIVKEFIQTYRSNQVTMDTIVQCATNYLSTPHGVANVKALKASMDGFDEVNPTSYDLATQIYSSPEMAPVAAVNSSDSSGLQALGLGISVNASFFVGVLAGADFFIDVKQTDWIYGRAWVGGSVKTGIEAAIGLEFPVLTGKPLTGVIAGGVMDIYLPAMPSIFVRISHIRQRPEGSDNFVKIGYSIQVGIGIGFPVRTHFWKHFVVIGAYGAKQWTYARQKLAKLTVVNNLTSKQTIPTNVTSELTLTFENTSGKTINFNSDAQVTVTTPSYFSASDVSAFKFTSGSSKWSAAANSSGQIIITPVGITSWDSGADNAIVVTISNVLTTNTPDQGQTSLGGKFTATLPNITFQLPASSVEEFDLVWMNSMATLTSWSAGVDTDDFTIATPSSGTNLVVYAGSSSQVNTLTTAVSKATGKTWVLGYVYNYNNTDPSDIQPQIYAAWWEQGTRQIYNNTFYPGGAVLPTSTTKSSEADYGGGSGGSNYVKFDVIFGTT